MRAALPKYGASGLGPVTVQWWSAFIQMLEDTMSPEIPCSPTSTWLFTELVDLKRSARPGAIELVLVSQQLLNMREMRMSLFPRYETLPLFVNRG